MLVTKLSIVAYNLEQKYLHHKISQNCLDDCRYDFTNFFLTTSFYKNKMVGKLKMGNETPFPAMKSKSPIYITYSLIVYLQPSSISKTNEKLISEMEMG